MVENVSDSRYAFEGYKNLIGPVIRLKRLSDDELFALISRITKLYAVNYGKEPRINEEQMVSFLNSSLSRAGADSMITPREMLRDYMTVLNILMQNEKVTFEQIMARGVGGEEKKEEEEKPSADEAPKTTFSAEDIEF